MKVIIVGAGVAGLATYLQLQKRLPTPNSHTIIVYEAHKDRSSSHIKPRPLPGPEALAVTDSAEVVGNMIALTPTTMRVLHYIDKDLHDLFRSRGCQNEAYLFKTARGHSLGMRPTDDGRRPSERTVSCPRALLRKCLLDIVGERNIQYQRVVAVHLEPGARPVVRLADGREESADLVLGADGVRSVVKTAILGPIQDAAQFSPHYEGFCGVGGFMKMNQKDLLATSVQGYGNIVFTFGPTGSFGYCLAAPPEQQVLGWWSNWGHAHIPESNVMDPDEIRRQLHERHGDSKDPIIQQIIQSSTTDRIYPIWTTPELPVWSAHGAVLLGDAAHTLPATSGQGAGQALEDSVVFSLLLSHYLLDDAAEPNHDISDAQVIQLAAQGLFEIQAPRVAAIKTRSRNLYLSKKRITSVLLEYVYYLYLYILIKIPLLSNVILGSVFDVQDDFDLEERVQKYLMKRKEDLREKKLNHHP